MPSTLSDQLEILLCNNAITLEHDESMTDKCTNDSGEKKQVQEAKAKLYSCNKCSYFSNFKHMLEKHQSKKHKHFLFICTECKIQFESKEFLRDHKCSVVT